MLDELDLQLFADGEGDGDDGEGNGEGNNTPQSSDGDVKNGDNNEGQGKEGNDDKTIPYWRFKELVEEKNNLQDKVKELKSKFEEMEDPEKIREEMSQTVEEVTTQAKNKAKISDLRVKASNRGVREEALDKLHKLVNLEQLELEDSEDKDLVELEVTNADELLDELEETDPYLFGNEDESGSTKTAGDFNTSNEGGEETEEQWLDKMMNLSQKY